jgi:hypothetical protein
MESVLGGEMGSRRRNDAMVTGSKGDHCARLFQD